MSTKVVPAPANQAPRLDRSEELAEQTEKQQAAQNDERLAEDDSDAAGVDVESVSEEVADAKAEAKGEKVVSDSETSLAGDFTFGEALAEAAAASGSLISEADEAGEVSFSNYGDGGSEGTILLIGAVLLVGVGIAALASGGGNDDPADDVPLNEDPTISSDDLTIDEDTSGNVTVTTDDPDGDTVTVTASVDNGSVADNGDGTFTYTPDPDFAGTATITFTADDGNGGSATSTSTVTVSPVQDAPSFNADTADIATDEDTPFNGDISGAASDPDGDTLTFSLATAATNGSVVVNADGTYTYTPDANFNGSDSYVVGVSDGNGGTDTITVNVTVAAVNDAPEFAAESADVTVGQNQTFTNTLVATDVDGDALTFGLETAATNGTAAVAADGTTTYTPNQDFTGTDSFVVNVSDGNGGTDTAVINVTVESGPTVTELPIDNGAADLLTFLGLGDTAPDASVVTLDADTAYVLGEDATSRTDLVLQNFNSDDVIMVENATLNLYSFGTGVGDPNDLRITLNAGGNFTNLVIDDALVGFTGFIFDYDDAVAALGFDFMTFA